MRSSDVSRATSSYDFEVGKEGKDGGEGEFAGGVPETLFFLRSYGDLDFVDEVSEEGVRVDGSDEVESELVPSQSDELVEKGSSEVLVMSREGRKRESSRSQLASVGCVPRLPSPA